MRASNPAPTKSNLLRERELLALAEEGYDLLERKREILMLELMRKLGEARLLEGQIRSAAREAYPVLRRTLLRGGLEAAREAAAGVEPDFSVRLGREQFAGTSAPTIEAIPAERILQVSALDSSVDSDDLSARFSRLSRLLAEMAALRAAVLALARETRKTQRRVNALERMVIPEAKAAEAYIEAALEERERESMFATKLLKSRKGGGGPC